MADHGCIGNPCAICNKGEYIVRAHAVRSYGPHYHFELPRHYVHVHTSFFAEGGKVEPGPDQPPLWEDSDLP